MNNPTTDIEKAETTPTTEATPKNVKGNMLYE